MYITIREYENRTGGYNVYFEINNGVVKCEADQLSMIKEIVTDLKRQLNGEKEEFKGEDL